MTTELAEQPADTTAEQAPARRRLRLLALTPGALAGLYLIWSASVTTPTGRRFTLFDDAMISMTYARTLARGGGLVWYEGAPRVEGITNPLWTLYMALLHAIGLEGSNAALAVSLTGLATVLVTALAAGHLARTIRPGSHTTELAAVTTTALLFPLLYWSVRGMEVGLITACVTVAMCAAVRLRDDRADGRASARALAVAAAAFVVGLATRPDFAVFVAVVVTWLAVTADSPKQRMKVLLILGGGSVAVIVLITVARVAYYGELLPNTYTLKATGVPLTDRLGRGLSTDIRLIPTVLMAAAATWLLVRGTSRPARHATLLVASVGAAAVAYSTVTGGDAWEDIPNRYTAPALVAATVLVAAALVRGFDVGRSAREYAKLAVAVCGLIAVAPMVTEIDADFDRYQVAGLLFGAVLPVALVAVAVVVHATTTRTRTVQMSLVLVALLCTTGGAGWYMWQTGSKLLQKSDQTAVGHGLQIAAAVKPGGTVAYFWAGAPQYYADRNAVDLLGKSDSHIARLTPRVRFYPGHDKWDYRWSVTTYRPDLIAGLWNGTPRDEEMLRDEGYEQRCLTGDVERAVWIRTGSRYIREDPEALKVCGADS